MNTNIIIEPLNKYLSEEKIKELFEVCYEDTPYWDYPEFVNGIALIGNGYNEYNPECQMLINKKGECISLKLDDTYEYKNGIVKNASSFLIYRIKRKKYKYNKSNTKLCEQSDEPTPYFCFQIENYSEKKKIHFILYNDKVISKFVDSIKYGVKLDKFDDCTEDIDRGFIFVGESMNYMVFSQAKRIYKESWLGKGIDGEFIDNYWEYFDPDRYNDYLDDDSYNYLETYYEEDFDDDDFMKIHEKYKNGEWDNYKAYLDYKEEIEEAELTEDEEPWEFDGKIPTQEEIDFFEENEDTFELVGDTYKMKYFMDGGPYNEFYKDKWDELFGTLYGIINVNMPSSKQLKPFTWDFEYVYNIISERERIIKEHQNWQNGWGWNPVQQKYNYFCGQILNHRFFKIPDMFRGYLPQFHGLTIKYVFEFYPKELLKKVESLQLLIQNKYLDQLRNNEITRKIRRIQESKLEYTEMVSLEDRLVSSDLYGVISTYQNKTIPEIIHCKGGVEHIVYLLYHSNLEINPSILEKLIDTSHNEIEKKCYNIILDKINDIKYYQELEEDRRRYEMEQYDIREANRLFNDMMDDFEAWGNIE